MKQIASFPAESKTGRILSLLSQYPEKRFTKKYLEEQVGKSVPQRISDLKKLGVIYQVKKKSILSYGLEYNVYLSNEIENGINVMVCYKNEDNEKGICYSPAQFVPKWALVAVVLCMGGVILALILK